MKGKNRKNILEVSGLMIFLNLSQPNPTQRQYCTETSVIRVKQFKADN